MALFHNIGSITHAEIQTVANLLRSEFMINKIWARIMTKSYG